MNQHTLPFGSLVAFVAIVATAYLLAPAFGTTAQHVRAFVPAQVGDTIKRTLPPTFAVLPSKLPVPLLAIIHDGYVAEPVEQAPALVAEVVPPPKPAGSESAKAMIELDGYKNIRGLVQISDGHWRGHAFRGSTEVALSVDASGTVSAE